MLASLFNAATKSSRGKLAPTVGGRSGVAQNFQLTEAVRLRDNPVGASLLASFFNAATKSSRGKLAPTVGGGQALLRTSS